MVLLFVSSKISFVVVFHFHPRRRSVFIDSFFDTILQVCIYKSVSLKVFTANKMLKYKMRSKK